MIGTHRQVPSAALVYEPAVPPARPEDRRLVLALGGLTREESGVAVLRFIEGYSVAEVARWFGREPGVVESIEHRALRHLIEVPERDEEEVTQ